MTCFWWVPILSLSKFFPNLEGEFYLLSIFKVTFWFLIKTQKLTRVPFDFWLTMPLTGSYSFSDFFFHKFKVKLVLLYVFHLYNCNEILFLEIRVKEIGIMIFDYFLLNIFGNGLFEFFFFGFKWFNFFLCRNEVESFFSLTPISISNDPENPFLFLFLFSLNLSYAFFPLCRASTSSSSSFGLGFRFGFSFSLFFLGMQVLLDFCFLAFFYLVSIMGLFWFDR